METFLALTARTISVYEWLRRAVFAAPLLILSSIGYGAPVLQSLAPLANDFTYGLGLDFTVVTGTGFADVTAQLAAVDLLIPSPGNSTSGCEAADFAGFPAGDIALIQRGTCAFADKVSNAVAAGAVGVLLFNEGNSPGRVDAEFFTMAPASFLTTPVFFASFPVGDTLRNGFLNGPTGYIVRMKLAPDDLVAAVPEPATLALLGVALAGVGFARRGKLR